MVLDMGDTRRKGRQVGHHEPVHPIGHGAAPVLEGDVVRVALVGIEAEKEDAGRDVPAELVNVRRLVGDLGELAGRGPVRVAPVLVALEKDDAVPARRDPIAVRPSHAPVTVVAAPQDNVLTRVLEDDHLVQMVIDKVLGALRDLGVAASADTTGAAT